MSVAPITIGNVEPGVIVLVDQLIKQDVGFFHQVKKPSYGCFIDNKPAFGIADIFTVGVTLIDT